MVLLFTRFTPKIPRSSQRPTSTFHPHSRVAQPVDRGGCLLSINVVISTSKLWSCARLVHNSICQGLGRSVFPLVHKPTTIILSSFKKLIFIVSCGQPCWMVSQAEVPDCLWTKFEHANGALASEGCMVDGVPVGVWKSYSDLGELISEGARANNLPEGRWWFYDQGVVREEVHYRQGVKHGIQVLHQDGVLTDSVVWSQGQKEGNAKSFRADGTLRLTTPYQRNVREGKSVQFNLNEVPHGFRWYKNDRLVASEVFNRRDEEGLKSGEWKVFHTSGRVWNRDPMSKTCVTGCFNFSTHEAPWCAWSVTTWGSCW